FNFNGKPLASVNKKWSGMFTELFTDKDTFMIDFTDERLTDNERKLVLAAAVFIDMKYFEAKAGN
ncbi:MAG: phospholipid scramblase-related protein, partial [Bdellovibrionota bacterium]